MAAIFHPNWLAVINKGEYVINLMGRNMQILLGQNLDQPVNLVICWTPGGLITGGTRQALRAAHTYGIEVRNPYNEEIG